MIIPSVNIPTSTSGSGTIARSQVLSGHIYNAGQERPEILQDLIVKYPNYWFAKLLEDIPSVTGSISTDNFSWEIMERTRKGATVTNVANGTSATATLTLDIAADGSTDLGYFLVGDEVRVANSGENGRVTAVSAAGGFQTIDVVRYAGGNWSTTLLPSSGTKIGHIGTGFARGSSASGGYRSYLPTYDYNLTTIHRRGIKIERGAMTQKTWVDEQAGYWYFKQEDFEQKEFMRDFHAKLLFGKRFQTRTGVQQNRGLMESAENSGNLVTFSSAVGVQESDWMSLGETLLPQQGSDDLVVLMGHTIFMQNQAALGDRYRRIDQGSQPAQIAGLNFDSYRIGNKNFHFKYFDMFSDEAIVPSITPSSTAKDFRNVALVLDMGMASASERNIQVKYREGAKFIQKLIPGMVGSGPEASNAYDGVGGELLCEFTNAVLLPNRCGLVYASS
jgi:hypothetical protein